MTPPTFQIGDEVLIIGPTEYGSEKRMGERFKIETHHKEGPAFGGRDLYSGRGFPWYPASSLQLIELQIGDFAEVTSPGSDNFGKVFKVTHIIDVGIEHIYTGDDIDYYYSMSDLRKLTPEEIEAHLHPIRVSATMDCSEFAERMAKCQDKLWKIGIEARLFAIEKQQKEQHEKISQFDGEISHLMGSIQECLMESGDVEARTRCREMAIEKRLDFVEQFQRDQTRDALCKGWSAGP
jgi:hypothetical protein